MNPCPIVDELSCKANLEPWFTTCALTPAANHSSIHLFWLWPFFVFRALLEVIEEIEIEGRVILVAGIGCHATKLVGAKSDMTTGAHRLAPAIATGLKHALYDDGIIVTVQGTEIALPLGQSSDGCNA